MATTRVLPGTLSTEVAVAPGICGCASEVNWALAAANWGAVPLGMAGRWSIGQQEQAL